jgi:hypothetical protein
VSNDSPGPGPTTSTSGRIPDTIRRVAVPVNSQLGCVARNALKHRARPAADARRLAIAASTASTGWPARSKPTYAIAVDGSATVKSHEGEPGPRDKPASGSATKGAAVTYLIVGLDRTTYARWHGNVSAREVGAAERIAQARAKAQGIDLVVAAAIGPNSAVMSDPAEVRTLGSKAA